VRKSPPKTRLPSRASREPDLAGPVSTRVPFVGLTGGIGAGKSEALRALEQLGAATLSTDAVVHDLLATDELRALLVERLGPRAAQGGEVDRSAVASLVFESPEHRSWLEGVLWPRVADRVARWRAEVDRRRPAPVAAVVEVPLLFESGMEAAFDCTVAVVADEAVRSERAAERGHAALGSRASRQLSQEEKAERADFVIKNDGDLAQLREGLSRLLATMGT
jgi:dephospho-CoA kinase